MGTVRDIGRLLDVAGNVLAASVYTQAQLHVWRTGLQMQVAGPPGTCPMCETPTLTQAKRTEIQQTTNQSRDYTRAAKAKRRR